MSLREVAMISVLTQTLLFLRALFPHAEGINRLLRLPCQTLLAAPGTRESKHCLRTICCRPCGGPVPPFSRVSTYRTHPAAAVVWDANPTYGTVPTWTV